MCGLTGYVGRMPAAEILVDSLKRLEYRGYDSCGIAVGAGDQLQVFKQVGAVDPFRQRILDESPLGTIGIGHTRWATHGRADEVNAHPHLSCGGEIAVVHNGIIENAEELRATLQAAGHRFLSTTDSEVIPHLLEQGLRDGQRLDSAFLDLPVQLEGSFAILAMAKGGDEIFLVRKGSPLVVGIGKDEYFPASDIPSFLPLTSRVAFLPEAECYVVSERGLQRLERQAGEVRRSLPREAPQAVNLSPLGAEKGNFEHFMIKEILEQGETLERVIASSPAYIEACLPVFRHTRQILLLGAGTSSHACLFGTNVLSTVARLPSNAYVASDFEYYAHLVEPGAVVLALSQSGETADLLAAVRLAKERGAVVIAVTNGELSSLARMSEQVILLGSGPEIAVAATKSYTSQLAVVTLLAHALAEGLEAGTRPLWQARDALINLTSGAARRHTQELARTLVESEMVFLLGRGAHYVTALEAALKLKEVAGLHAEAFHGGEMKHGPLALIQEGTPVIHFYDEREAARAEVTCSELATRGARILTVGPRPLRSSEIHIRVDEAATGTPIAQIVPMQILAYEVARFKDLDPDHPRNLAKSVTVT